MGHILPFTDIPGSDERVVGNKLLLINYKKSHMKTLFFSYDLSSFDTKENLSQPYLPYCHEDRL